MIRTWKIQRIGLFAAFRTGVIVCGLMGLVVGVLAASGMILFSALIMAALKTDISQFGIVIAVIVPLVWSAALAVLGGGAAFLAALGYNLAAGVFGGIAVDMEEVKPILYNDIYGDFSE